MSCSACSALYSHRMFNGSYLFQGGTEFVRHLLRYELRQIRKTRALKTIKCDVLLLLLFGKND
jgi:hypothetical protein